MKLKLTYIQFMALLAMFKWIVEHSQPEGIEQKMIYTIMVGIYKKLFARSVEKKRRYCISISPVEAMGFYLNWCDHQLEDTSHEGNLINSINNSIHQKYVV